MHFFRNEKFLGSYGDHRGKLLIDLLNEITCSHNGDAQLPGQVLFKQLLDEGKIQSINGCLANKRVELFAKAAGKI